MYLKFSRLLSDLLLVAGILCFSVSIFSCKDDSDTVEIPTPEGETLSVALTIDFSNEADGYATHTRGADDGQDASFEAKPHVVSTTRSSDLFPTDLYNLEVRQYNRSGTCIGGTKFTTAQSISSRVSVSLSEDLDCQLLIVARGSNGAVPELGTRTLSAVQKSIIASSSIISSIDPSSDMNTMPYFLYLPHVNVVDAGGGLGTIQSAENGTEDVRLRLKRLVARVTLNWSLSDAMKTQGYELKEVKLCQVPSTYYLLPESEETSEWGTTYPSTVSEFVDVYRLTGTDLTNANGSKSVWIPANVRGTSSASTAPIHRTKENAPTAASYAEIVVDNTVKKERLYYRAYLGGNDPSDFNLNENTDYNWTLNIKSADYTGDPRIELLDQTPVQSENLVPTANCLMLQPGGNLCFNPYQHTAGTNSWNDYLVNNPGTSSPSAKTEIASVKVLWQTKDAGMSGDLVLGYVIDDTNHKNLANITKGDDINQARVHVKAPVTNGGNAVIAAYAADGKTVLWSWHVWITDYAPVPLLGTINASTRETAISTAQSATRNGAVQVYQGISWTDPAGAFYKCVIMDRNLGAIRAGIQNNSLDGVRTFGLLYQGGRKDPFFGTADGTTEEKKTIYDGYGVQTQIERRNLTTLDALVRSPLAFCANDTYDASGNWNGDRAKTIHDPCPYGWRVPSNGVTPAPNDDVPSSVADNTSKYCMMAGFGSTNTSLVYEATPPAFNNVMYYNGTSIVAINKISPIETSTFVGSGFVYYGTNEGPEGDKSIFFPGVSLRERGTGDYRTTVQNNSVYLWASTKSNENKYLQLYCIQLNSFFLRHPVHWTYGFSVRCVQDNIQPK